MFNLNEEIKNWKLQLQKHGTTTGNNLEELEGHLLEEIDNLKEVGLSEKESFLVASHRLGNTENISEEFCKVNKPVILAQRLLWICVGAVLCLLSLDFVKLLSTLSALITAPHFDSLVLQAIVSISIVVLINGVLIFCGFYYSECIFTSRLFKAGRIRTLWIFILALLLFSGIKAINTICGIIFARMFSPTEFGEMGIVSSFTNFIIPFIMMLLLLGLAIKYRAIRHRGLIS